MFFASVQHVHLGHSLHEKSISLEWHFLKYYQLKVNRVNGEVPAFVSIRCHGYLVTSGMAVGWGCRLLHPSWRDLSSSNSCNHGGFVGGFVGHWKISEGLWQVVGRHSFFIYWSGCRSLRPRIFLTNQTILFLVRSPDSTEPMNWMLCNSRY